jgi:hypothetical protein
MSVSASTTNALRAFSVIAHTMATVRTWPLRVATWAHRPWRARRTHAGPPWDHEGRPECIDDVREGDLHCFWNVSLALAAWQRNWQHVLRWSSHASHHVRVVARCGVYRATLSALASLRSHGRCESDSGSKVQHHRERARRLVEALLEAEEAPSGYAAAA